MARTRRMIAGFKAEDYQKLEAVADKRGVDVSEIFKEVIRVGFWYETDVLDKGRSLFVGEKGSQRLVLSEVVLDLKEGESNEESYIDVEIDPDKLHLN